MSQEANNHFFQDYHREHMIFLDLIDLLKRMRRHDGRHQKDKDPRSQQKEAAQIGKAVIKNVVLVFKHPKKKTVEQ